MFHVSLNVDPKTYEIKNLKSIFKNPKSRKEEYAYDYQPQPDNFYRSI